MVRAAVPDFFQEDTPDAQRQQIDWLTRQLGLDHAFFEKLLGAEKGIFSNWREGAGSLPPGGEETLRDFWHAVLHVLSFLNFDEARARDIFRKTIPMEPSDKLSLLTPPWSGMSLQSYLERTRATGIQKLADWVTGLRFGDPYAA
jgi:hypothetical protein